ncbi:hypothetical protein J1G35_26745 [Pseudomonas sp. SH10-3B]|uniref:hypothetical protein n=1 Tax=Pseudomonas sp. SH10-3B TaxID=2816049 RepID=UPI001CA6BADD|nr:hypothetical protein [Pseudomonas sp. SH10-3B]MBY8949465.1 hypothetical protein [Pseudomonas sp. SH10-3B]
MRAIEEIARDVRINDLQRIYPNSERVFREVVLKQVGDVDSLAYAKEFIRLQKQAELLKAYNEANQIPEIPQETDIDITVRILKEKYAK